MEKKKIGYQLTEEDFIKFANKHKDRWVCLEPNELDVEFLKAIGLVTVSFSKLEEDIRVLCGSYIENYGNKFIGRIFTSEYSFKQLLKVTRSLLVTTGYIDEKDSLFSDINKIEEKRNQIIHSYYGNKTDNTIFRYKNKNISKGHIRTSSEITIDDINVLSIEINRISKKIIDIALEVKKHETDN